jgi:hypothetical protein
MGKYVGKKFLGRSFFLRRGIVFVIIIIGILIYFLFK